MRFRLLVVLLAITFFAVGCSSADDAVQESDDAISTFLDTGQAPGVVVGRWPAGGALNATAAGTDEAGELLRADQVFPLASISKLFVAVIVHQLAEVGALSLDDPVARYVPDWPRGEQVTLRHLLLHQSGLQDAGNVFVVQVVGDLGRAWEPTEVLEFVQREPLAFEQPGTDAHYSDSNTQLLAHIVTLVTGRSLGQELQDRILGPLDMDDSFYGPEALDRVTAADFSGRASTTSLLGAGTPNDIGELDQTALQTAFPASSGVWASASDLLIFLDALFRSERLLPATAVAEMIDTNEHDYGLGVEHFFGAVGHRGTYFGSHTVAMYDPDSALIVVVFGNAFDFEDYNTRPLLELAESEVKAAG